MVVVIGGKRFTIGGFRARFPAAPTECLFTKLESNSFCFLGGIGRGEVVEEVTVDGWVKIA